MIMKFLSGEDTGEWLNELTDSSHLKGIALYTYFCSESSFVVFAALDLLLSLISL